MPPISAGVFERLLPSFASAGYSANETLSLLRAAGYRKQTQAFFSLYRQARASVANVPEISILSKNAYIPDRLHTQAPDLSTFRYRYVARVESMNPDTGETSTVYRQLGSSRQLNVGEIEAQVQASNEDAKESSNVNITGITVEAAYYRGD